MAAGAAPIVLTTASEPITKVLGFDVLGLDPTVIQFIGTIIFALAVIHTFLVKKFEKMAHDLPEGSFLAENLHFLGEVEAVFGFWSAIFLACFFLVETIGSGFNVVHGFNAPVAYMDSLNFTEPVFVFVVMTVAATRPILVFAEKIIMIISKLIPLPGRMAFYVATLIFGPILGSFITEPAAMTVTALILLDYFYSSEMSTKFKYATLGILFVNVSIGGTLTHFAAPPVLMVAGPWKWDMTFMMTHFGWKSCIAVVINTIAVAIIFKHELKGHLEIKAKHDNWMEPTWWMIAIHLIFMVLTVLTAHHMVMFLGIFLFFLGFTRATREYQDKLKLMEALLVGFFLGGLVTLGKQQGWWISPLLQALPEIPLFLGSTALTAITDNAALTYLGSQVPNLAAMKKYYLVAGAVAGGGLTVIANAPNPAGFGILKNSFGENGISPLGLLAGALIPTIIAVVLLGVLPPYV